MLNRNEILRIERTLAKLQEGDLYDPVETRGFGTYHSIAVRLEALRVAMLKLKDSETDSSLRANKSIASVAHDMKTPLAIISGYAECISDGMDDKDYPALIIQKTDQMNEMVIGMVESSNAEIRKQSAHKTLHPARNFFGKTIEKLRPLAQARNIKLQVGKIPDVEVRVDEGQMERVVQNLLSNAVKYSDKGQTVKIGAKKKGKRFILYVVREIMKDHGGEVYVKSKKGKGSTFSIVLPLEADDVAGTTATARFDNLSLTSKCAIEFFFGWAMTFIYRFAKYSQTRQRHTLVTGLLSFALFVFVWPIDFISVLVYGKLTFLAD